MVRGAGQGCERTNCKTVLYPPLPSAVRPGRRAGNSTGADVL